MTEGWNWLRGSGLKTRIKHPVDEFWDRRLGIRTLGFAPAVGDHNAPDVQFHYVPTPYRKLLRTLRRAKVGRGDVFVDFGSGLGRAVFLASWLGVKRSVGIEVNAELVEMAMANLRISRFSDADIKFFCTPAQSYNVDDMTILYMFHPFGPGTMAQVIENIDKSLDGNPRKLTVIYENPVNAGVVNASRHLKIAETWAPGTVSGSRYAVSFWRAGEMTDREVKAGY